MKQQKPQMDVSFGFSQNSMEDPPGEADGRFRQQRPQTPLIGRESLGDHVTGGAFYDVTSAV